MLGPSLRMGKKLEYPPLGSYHVSINVTLIRSKLIAGSRFTGGQ